MVSNQPRGLNFRLRQRSRRAFTLVEVMIATAVFTMGILGVYAMMIKSYEMVTMARHRDNGRAVLLSYVDQFLRLSVNDSGVTRGIFVPHSATGLGLTWTDSSGGFTDGNAYDVPEGMPVWLGDSGNSLIGSRVQAHVSRTLLLLDPATGLTTSNTLPTLTAAGYLMQATFTISYPIAGRTQAQSITVVRSGR